MRLVALFCFVLANAATVQAEVPTTVDFAREVRPILADFCFRCHGPDAKRRQADVRLDQRDEATRAAKSKRTPIVAGKPESSELVRRIFADDDDVMPPRDTGQTLTAAQKETLQRWIAEGAKYQTHWSFLAPTRPAFPNALDLKSEISNLSFQISNNPIDRFVFARIAAAGLRPSPEADRVTLQRRVTLDLTGLPPSIEEVDDFLADQEPGAFERVVDRLLASPRYGEHMARDWLDQARYADTHGFFTDHERFMWRWRDWVINAYNADMPFDQFTIEQLAGDLLPNPTLEQRIATGFNRNHMITEETGVIPEEYRVEYVADRVRTTAVVWMGLTAGCAQCHDHKYDPLTQREFYQLFAYFNQLPESGIAGGKQKNAAPELRLPTAEQTVQLDELQHRLCEAQTKLSSLPKDVNATAKKTLDEELKQLREDEKKLLATIPTVMVMQDQAEPRETFILERGQYDQPREKVSPGVPSFLPALPSSVPPNRLALAQWLVDPRHPLTARVAVNRHWRQMFGRGLVSTVEDFGVQGELPSHPELLDWLAIEFVGVESPESRGQSEDNGHQSFSHGSRLSTLNSRLAWSVKRLQRLIVTSATYRQASAITAEHRRVDPENRLLARAPRYRLDAETIRDSALFISGLLAERIGGPSVKPYQPADLWKAITYDTKNTQEYVQSTGDGLYRRGFYTYWKRQIPPPSLWQLDAPTRETCVLRRQRTNTPLQALVLLNDTQFVEAARALAQRVLSSDLASDRARVMLAFRRAVAREPSAPETNSLLRLLLAERGRFEDDRSAADALLSVGEWPVPMEMNRSELAAWTVLANALLNLDEALSRE